MVSGKYMEAIVYYEAQLKWRQLVLHPDSVRIAISMLHLAGIFLLKIFIQNFYSKILIFSYSLHLLIKYLEALAEARSTEMRTNIPLAQYYFTEAIHIYERIGEG